MNNSIKVKEIEAYSILDSRGVPTVECRFLLSSGSIIITSVPSGASTGSYELPELRDNDIDQYNGMGVNQSIAIINKQIGPLLCNRVPDLAQTDALLNEINRSKYNHLLGSNTMLALSLSTLKAAANIEQIPLFEYISKYIQISTERLPRIIANLINGGMHAENGLTWQEYSVVNTDETTEESIQKTVELYQLLKKKFHEKRIPLAVGDEGGFAAFNQQINHKLPLQWLSNVIDELQLTTRFSLAIDAAASTWHNAEKNVYKLDQHDIDSLELIDRYKQIINRYNVSIIEDPFGQDDQQSWQAITKYSDKKTIIIGDDLFASEKNRLKKGNLLRLADGLILKPNQVGTMSALFETALYAKQANMPYIVSHRSGETLDDSIVDIAIGLGAWGIKCGAPARGERIVKYNRFLAIFKLLDK